MWDNYNMFLIAPLVITRLQLDKIYHLELPYDWLMLIFVWLTWWFDSKFLLQISTRETGGLEISSTITPVLRVNRPTKLCLDNIVCSIKLF